MATNSSYLTGRHDTTRGASEHDSGRETHLEAFSTDRRSLRLTGAVALVAGTLALIFPFAASIGVSLVTGAAVAALGIVELVRAFRLRRAGRIAATVLFGLVALFTGALFLIAPVAGVFSLTLLLIAYLVVGGVQRALSARKYARGEGRWAMLAAGVLSLLLAVLLFLLLPSAATWALGVIFGVDSIFFAFAAFATASALKRREAHEDGAGTAAA